VLGQRIKASAGGPMVAERTSVSHLLGAVTGSLVRGTAGASRAGDAAHDESFEQASFMLLPGRRREPALRRLGPHRVLVEARGTSIEALASERARDDRGDGKTPAAAYDLLTQTC
jgi:hypothetical protein